MTFQFLQVQTKDAVHVRADHLRDFVSQLIYQLGVSIEDARIAADVLVTADLRGVDSHGVSVNLKSKYIPGLTEGHINPTPNEQVVQETQATALIDGDRGLGHPTVFRGMELAIRKARQTGVGVVSIKNSTHNGMIGYYPQMAVREGMIGVTMTAGGSPTVLPTFGAKPMLSTNPLSIAAPASLHPAFVLDMATSVFANGKASIASLLGVSLLDGWTVDENLLPTTDPTKHPLFWLPLGGGTVDLGGHKGFGLALAVEILCSVLSGHGYCGTVPQDTEFQSHFLMAIDIAAFRPIEEFKRMMDEMIDEHKRCPSMPGHDQIYIAGEPEWLLYNKRLETGIPLHKDVFNWLRDTGGQLGVDIALT